jgi:hypothetical protein
LGKDAKGVTHFLRDPCLILLLVDTQKFGFCNPPASEMILRTFEHATGIGLSMLELQYKLSYLLLDLLAKLRFPCGDTASSKRTVTEGWEKYHLLRARKVKSSSSTGEDELSSLHMDCAVYP